MAYNAAGLARQWADMMKKWAEDATFAAYHLNDGLIKNWKINNEREISNKLPISPHPSLHKLPIVDWQMCYDNYYESVTKGTMLNDDWKSYIPFPEDENTWRTGDVPLVQPVDPIDPNQPIDVGQRSLPWYNAARGDASQAGTLYNHPKYGLLEKFTYASPWNPAAGKWRAANESAELIWHREMRKLGF